MPCCSPPWSQYGTQSRRGLSSADRRLPGKILAVGRFPGGFLKRESRMSEYEILISRLIDRALRPMFPDDYHADTPGDGHPHLGDKNVQPDALAGFAASAAITISDIPFNGPISECASRASTASS
ncbi:hypothetical protein [Candidatus Pollutiaquabacter sp.]|uniref:hypothetical protein n=1 Tax=Candidatus Pollutiaquabacter sp. TaxID=3416354 RepID=UPI003D11D95E